MIQESFLVQPIAPFRLDLTVWALRRRATNSIDQWNGTDYTRVLLVDDVPVKVCVAQRQKAPTPELLVNVWSTVPIECLSSRVGEVLRRMLGFDIDLSGFYTVAKSDTTLSALSQHFLGMKPPRFPSLFEAFLNAFACQQITLDVGMLLLNRLTAMYGITFDDGQTVCSAFPRPEEIATTSGESLRALGFSHQKARAMIELATALVQEQRDFSLLEGMNNEEVSTSISPIRGVGRWTAEYILLRGLGRIDMFPGDDVGAQNNLQRLLHLVEKPSYATIKVATAAWQPYAGLVYFHLLLDNLAKKGVLLER
ncbi:MAG: DNA-3-methyladenine glycosylase 2 family protein [Chloroflexota bacterium]|nr:DNA-3-methyladenine glycosylase 2 family protein [Chloroflexota bacterium]